MSLRMRGFYCIDCDDADCANCESCRDIHGKQWECRGCGYMNDEGRDDCARCLRPEGDEWW